MIEILVVVFVLPLSITILSLYVTIYKNTKLVDKLICNEKSKNLDL